MYTGACVPVYLCLCVFVKPKLKPQYVKIKAVSQIDSSNPLGSTTLHS